MFNEMLDRLTGHNRYRPFDPAFAQEEWRHAFSWSSARSRWVATCKKAATTDRVEELHGVRDQYLRVLEAYSHIIKGMLLLVDEGTEGSPARSRLQFSLDDVQALHADLLTRWVTLDDLYAIIVEYLSPTAEQARQIAATSRPPQSWYDEDADPFSPVD